MQINKTVRQSVLIIGRFGVNHRSVFIIVFGFIKKELSKKGYQVNLRARVPSLTLLSVGFFFDFLKQH